MVTVSIEGYLVQEKLEQALMSIVGTESWRGREVLVSVGRKFRWDMAYQRDGHLVVVEFDGDEHYRHSLKLKVDREKDRLAQELGHVVVRFPYWLQLTSQTLEHFFDLAAVVEQSFPHGFITTKVFPASYSELGVERFAGEYAVLPRDVQLAVTGSLRARTAEHGLEYVLPKTLGWMLADDGDQLG